jgi:uncharacterized ferritin-like protein (DUF455 family)
MPRSVREFCRRVLESGDLDDKLAPPHDAVGARLPDDDPGPALEIDRPARAPGLEMTGGSEKLPRPGSLGDAAARAACLARFAHHELMAVEMFAWALLRWPDMPAGLRAGLLGALEEEQIHCRLYLARLDALGRRLDEFGHSDYFWRQAPVIAASPQGPCAFLAGMGLTLEQANLDFTLLYRDAFREHGDEASARVCQRVYDDEVGHVRLAAEWMMRLRREQGSDSGEDQTAAYQASVPFPLAANRAKGRRFDVAGRRAAGLDEAFIDHVRQAKSSQQTGVVPGDARPRREPQ